MAHIQKHKKQASWLLFAHNDREEENNRTFSNEKIDKSKTCLNYNLNYLLREDFQNATSYQRLNKRLEELKKGNGNKKIPKKEFSVYEIRQIKKECKEKGEEFIESDYYDFVFKDFRKDANTIVSLCVQIPRDENGELVFPTLDEQKIFFEGVCNYLIENYGKENMIDFQIHMDESTPHLHACFVPAVINENGIESLSCKKVVTLQMLQSLHPTLQLYLEDYLKRNDFSIIQDKPTKSNIDMKEFKGEIKIQEIEDKTNERINEIKNNYEDRLNYVENEKNKKLETMQKEYNNKIVQFDNAINKKRERYNDMCFKIGKKEDEIKTISELNAHSIQGDILSMGKNNFFGNGKTYTQEEIDIIINNAKICDAKIYEYNNHKKDIASLEKNYGEQVSMKNDMLENLSEKISELKNENIKLQMYKDFVQENKVVEFEEYKKDKVIVDMPTFGLDDFGRYSHHNEKKIISMNEYLEMKSKDKSIKKINDMGMEL